LKLSKGSNNYDEEQLKKKIINAIKAKRNRLESVESVDITKDYLATLPKTDV